MCACDCSRFVVAVGWDRHINVYIDSVEDVRQVQQPQSYWPDDIVNIALLQIIFYMFESGHFLSFSETVQLTYFFLVNMI